METGNSLTVMKKGGGSSSSSSSQNLASFPSPGAPYYRDRTISHGNNKGWSSERVAKAGSNNNNNSSRRHTMAGLTPFSGGRTMPSKWDEAERWICSPVSADHSTRRRRRSSTQSHSQLERRPKSISGPIVPPPGPGAGGGLPFYSNYSPSASAVPLRQGLVVRNLMVGSPFSTGVFAPVAVSVHHHYDDNVFGYDMDDTLVQYSSSPVLNQNGVFGLLHSSVSHQQPCDPSSPIYQDEEHDGKENEDTVTFVVPSCDKGTQMSPTEEAENDAHSSPKSSANLVMDQDDGHSPKLEVRDVQVDSQASVTRGSKRHAAKLAKKDSLHSEDLKLRQNTAEAQASCWDIEESTLDTSKLQREEAKIIAWENLQKAKAEAEIRKLEMKLEKKRSSSMDKILKKLRRAQLKAENMRSSTPAEEVVDHQVSKTCKVFSLPKYVQIWSPSSCFSSHAE